MQTRKVLKLKDVDIDSETPFGIVRTVRRAALEANDLWFAMKLNNLPQHEKCKSVIERCVSTLAVRLPTVWAVTRSENGMEIHVHRTDMPFPDIVMRLRFEDAPF